MFGSELRKAWNVFVIPSSRRIPRSAGLPSDMNGSLHKVREAARGSRPMQGGLVLAARGASRKVSNAGLDGDVIYSIAGHSGRAVDWQAKRRPDTFA